MQLLAEGADYRADEQRAEKALRHCAKSVYTVAPGGENDVFPFEECFEFFHFKVLFGIVV